MSTTNQRPIVLFRNTEYFYEQIPDTSALRDTLSLAGLYLLAYEVLKTAIVENIADLFVDFFGDKLSERLEELDKAFGSETAERERQHYEQQFAKYEAEVNVKFSDRKAKGFMPSCVWLQKVEIFDADDIPLAKSIRTHRNQIAHELPELLLQPNSKFEVRLDFIVGMRALLRKVDVAFAKIEFTFEPDDAHRDELLETPPESIVSSREVMLDLVELVETNIGRARYAY